MVSCTSVVSVVAGMAAGSASGGGRKKGGKFAGESGLRLGDGVGVEVHFAIVDIADFPNAEGTVVILRACLSGGEGVLLV